MKLNSLHLLLTYECNLQCDHCFVWGSPWQRGTMTLADVDHILTEAEALGGIESIYFEGGEAFLYYVTLVRGVEMAVERGFKVGIVSNGYWATSLADAIAWLEPLAGKLVALSVSRDAYHWDEKLAQRVANAHAAAARLEIPTGTISVAQPDNGTAAGAVGQLPPGESAVMFRGRAAAVLSQRAELQPWETFTRCPYEDLRDPGRVHVDPLGHVHICQGISLGSLFETPLRDLVAHYVPDEHPIAGPILAAGPAALVRRYAVAHAEAYADACHLCYETRLRLRERFPDQLAPDQMYGLVG